MNQYLQEKCKSDKNGIFVFDDETVVDTAFSKETQNGLLQLEDESWWFQYRADVIEKIAEKYFHKELPVYDIGGGNGYTTSVMRLHGWNTNLIEPNYQACINAKIRGLETVICGTVSSNTFEKNFFDSVMLLDVLEHIEDDKNFLKVLYEKLKINGYMLITVPAFKQLWSSEDDLAGHFRRYTLKMMSETAKESGFKIMYLNYFFGFLYFPILIIRHFEEKFGFVKPTEQRTPEEEKVIYEKEFKVKSGLVSNVLSFLEKRELRKISKRKHIHLGTSIICVLKKV